MSGKKRQAAGQGSAVPPESPLVPNRTLQRMYSGMVESRLLEALLRKRDRKTVRPAVRGQEACRVGAVLDLTPDDFSSDPQGTATTAFLRGEPLVNLPDPASPLKFVTPGLLPSCGDSRERLHQAIGVAIALKLQKPGSVVVVFAEASELKPAAWRGVLHSAAALELPMFFVVLPSESKVKPGDLSAQATAAGVPGIPVDASDAIALYRVAQESLGRARAGGGPALMECIPFVVSSAAKKRKKGSPDPVLAMGASLLRRKVCDEGWLAGVAVKFKARLKTL